MGSHAQKVSAPHQVYFLGSLLASLSRPPFQSFGSNAEWDVM